MDADLSWSSSDNLVVTVDQGGILTSQVAAGSATVTAAADGVKSRPVMVIAALPALNTMLVTDDETVGEPVLVNATEEYGLGVLYTVSLTDVPVPSVGTTLLASEDKAVGGRVVEAVEETDGTVTVTLELVGLDELFTELVIDQTVELTNEDIVIPSAVFADFDVEQVADGTYSFTYVSEAAAAAKDPTSTLEKSSPEDIREEKGFSSLSCTIQAGFPLTIAGLKVSFKPKLLFQTNYDSNSGYLKLAAKGSVIANGTVDIGLNQAIDAKFDFNADFLEIIIPTGGPISLFLTGKIPIGAGFSVGGKITYTDMTIEYKGKVEPSLELGIVCPGGPAPCEYLTDLSADVNFDPGVKFISQPAPTFDIQPSLQLYLTGRLSVGPPWLPGVSFDFLELKAGPTESFNLDTVYDQIKQSTFANYVLALDTSIGLAADSATVLRLLKVNAVQLGVQVLNVPLYSSPTAQSFTANDSSPAKGDVLSFQLDLQDTLYPLPLTPAYNVDSVRLWRIEDAANPAPVLIGNALAGPSQSIFNIPWTVVSSNGALYPGGDIYAFVDTKLINRFVFADDTPIGVGKLSLNSCPANVVATFVEFYPDGRFSSGEAYWSGQWDLSDAGSAFTDFPLDIHFQWDLANGQIIPGSDTFAVLRNRFNTASTGYTTSITGTVMGETAKVVVDWPDNTIMPSDQNESFPDQWPVPEKTNFELSVGYTCVDVNGQQFVCRGMDGTHDTGPTEDAYLYGIDTCD